MSQKEGKIYHYFEQVAKKYITLTKAAKYLDLSYRHVKRLWKEYKVSGIIAIVSKRRGKASNRKIPDKQRDEIAAIISRNYPDFKPTLVTEMLEEHHNIIFSKETIRMIMVEHQLWFVHSRKCNPHQRRKRRAYIGELVQTDASEHLWFEGRGPECHLYIIIDDATSEIGAAYFEKEETTQGYFKTFEIYFNKVGLPVSVYSDKRGVFKVNQGRKSTLTQFGRALKELEIKLIFAHSPQAKGRVERAFGTLQDRLIKEMRLENISTIKDGNKFLPGFLKKYNLKFAKAPSNAFNAHRPLDKTKPLKYILCFKHQRIVSKNLEINFDKEVYQIQADKAKRNLKDVTIDVLETMEGEIRFEYQGEEIKCRKYNEIPYQISAPEVGKKPAQNMPKQKNQIEVSQQKKKKEATFTKVVELRGYYERSELLTDEEKQAAEIRVKEQKQRSREDNKEILKDRAFKGGAV